MPEYYNELDYCDQEKNKEKYDRLAQELEEAAKDKDLLLRPNALNQRYLKNLELKMMSLRNKGQV